MIGLSGDVESHAKTGVLNHSYQNVWHRGGHCVLSVVCCRFSRDSTGGFKVTCGMANNGCTEFFTLDEGLRMWTFLLTSGAAVKRRTSLYIILFMSLARPSAPPRLGGRRHPGASPFYMLRKPKVQTSPVSIGFQTQRLG